MLKLQMPIVSCDAIVNKLILGIIPPEKTVQMLILRGKMDSPVHLGNVCHEDDPVEPKS